MVVVGRDDHRRRRKIESGDVTLFWTEELRVCVCV